jgi:lipopolysaccharide export LptBFGC system permease protein LptF
MSLKKVLVTFLLSTTLLIGGVFSTTVFAYSQSVERKLEKINKNIAKQNEKISKQSEKMSNRDGASRSSGSSVTKTQKIRDKISDLEEQAAKIKKKEDDKISKIVNSIEGRKKQSLNKISNLEKNKTNKRDAARSKYENDIKLKKAADPTYIAPVFKFNSTALDKQLEKEKSKLIEYDEDIAKVRGTYEKKEVKKKK